jgi:hypothetical protein
MHIDPQFISLSTKTYSEEFRVRKLPLLDQVVQFHL